MKTMDQTAQTEMTEMELEMMRAKFQAASMERIMRSIQAALEKHLIRG